MKEYTLLFPYPTITYTSQQLETLKQQWSKTLSDWRAKRVYVSNQVFEPKGTIITSQGNKDEEAFAKSSTFKGAAVTLLAESKEQVVALAKEAPVFTVGGSVEIREPRYTNKNNRVIFIDTFTIPKQSKEAFITRMTINRKLIKTMPGFIEDHAYEKSTGDSKFNYITVAIWESEEAVIIAKKAVSEQYKKENFNLVEFINQNQITLERAMYRDME